MKLPAGATGFGGSGQAAQGDLRSFLAACHHAARLTGGTVTASRPAGVTPSFHTVVVAYRHGHMAVLRHELLGLAALVHAPDWPVLPPLAFADHPGLAQAIRDAAGCQVLSAADLNASVTTADLSQLSAAEHEQIRYWKPATVGELLFNYWD